jgi:hypothetical protein
VLANIHFHEGDTMKVSIFLAAILLALGPHAAQASTAYGDLNNFDVINDTGEECHGFEIEIEDIHSTDITYTYDWNHYGAPRITEDNSNPLHPKVTIRYESAKNANGSWAAFTAVPAAPLTPTDGHMCTNPSVNEGCEHFGVGYYGAPTAIRYNWLVDRNGALVHHSSPVLVATPTWNYWPPVDVQPAVAVAVIPAPVVEIPPAMEFGEPVFVKVIKTTWHNAGNVALGDLISADLDNDGEAEWQNNEPDEVETEFKLLQTNLGVNPAKEELPGAEDDMGDGSDTVTRRYEFYRYGAAADTIDAENGEAKCDEVDPTTNPNNPQYLHGIGDAVSVTDANGNTYFVDCAAQVVVGDYIGAQMAGFDAAMPLGLVDHLQDGEKDLAYTPRSLVVGGDTPYDIAITGNLPAGLTLGDYTDPDSGQTLHGVLYGTPTAAGNFNFTVEATDASAAVASNSYVLTVTGIVPPAQYVLVVETFGAGSGTVAGGGIDCGATCDVLLDAGTEVTLTATPAAGSVFTGWAGACTGTADCNVTLNADTGVSATFVPAALPYTLNVAYTGSGKVTSKPKGINCGKQCSSAYTAGTSVTLTATPARKHQFLGWSGDCSGTQLTCTVPMLGVRNVTANFN